MSSEGKVLFIGGGIANFTNVRALKNSFISCLTRSFRLLPLSKVSSVLFEKSQLL